MLALSSRSNAIVYLALNSVLLQQKALLLLRADHHSMDQKNHYGRSDVSESDIIYNEYWLLLPDEEVVSTGQMTMVKLIDRFTRNFKKLCID